MGHIGTRPSASHKRISRSEDRYIKFFEAASCLRFRPATDTVGTKTDRPFAMIDLYGTPYTKALRVVERYRLIDYDVAKEGLERDAKENRLVPGDIDAAHRGKFLQVKFTVEDEGAFTTPWTATITYRPAPGPWQELSAPRTSMNIIIIRTPRSQD
jgi:hypothetical protein